MPTDIEALKEHAKQMFENARTLVFAKPIKYSVVKRHIFTLKDAIIFKTREFNPDFMVGDPLYYEYLQKEKDMEEKK